MQAVRTNNDAEGWHNRLNRKIREKHPNLYKLVPVLHYESRKLPLQVTLVCQGSITRRMQKTYTNMQERLFSIWKEYNDRKIGPLKCLKKCADLYGPE